MKRARFTEEQIIAMLKEHEAGAKTADLTRKHRISGADRAVPRAEILAHLFSLVATGTARTQVARNLQM
jgi:hypothetical protein